MCKTHFHWTGLWFGGMTSTSSYIPFALREASSSYIAVSHSLQYLECLASETLLGSRVSSSQRAEVQASAMDTRLMAEWKLLSSVMGIVISPSSKSSSCCTTASGLTKLLYFNGNWMFHLGWLPGENYLGQKYVHGMITYSGTLMGLHIPSGSLLWMSLWGIDALIVPFLGKWNVYHRGMITYSGVPFGSQVPSGWGTNVSGCTATGSLIDMSQLSH